MITSASLSSSKISLSGGSCERSMFSSLGVACSALIVEGTSCCLRVDFGGVFCLEVMVIFVDVNEDLGKGCCLDCELEADASKIEV
jgi:hypothetical protein